MIKRWRDASKGDLLYVVVHSKYLMMFSHKIDVPEMFTARIEDIEISDRTNKEPHITCSCIRNDSAKQFKIYLNGFLPSMRSVEFNGTFYETNKSDSLIASYTEFDSEDVYRVVFLDKDLFNSYILSLREKSKENAKQKIGVIKEQLKIINQNLKLL